MIILPNEEYILDVLTLEYEGETTKLVPCKSCGMYALLNLQNYLLLETMCNNKNENINFTCETCSEKISMLHQIKDLNEKITKLRERISSLKLIRDIENEIDTTAENLSNSVLTDKAVDELTSCFANFSINSNAPLLANNIIIPNYDSTINDASCITSIWGSESESNSTFLDYNSQFSFFACTQAEDVTNNELHDNVIQANETVNSVSVSTESENNSNVENDELGETNLQSVILQGNGTVKSSENVDTVVISDTFMSGVLFQKSTNIHSANYPSAKIETIINAIEHFSNEYDELKTVVVHTGTNDIRYGRKTEELKKSFHLLHQKTESLDKKLVISGPVPTINCSSEHFSYCTE